LPKILADENIPLSAMEWLKRKGFTVLRVSEINLKGAKDNIIAG
jgi:predicted nuclease of predicted toxin-antitoxin system